MSGTVELEELLATLSPVLYDTEYVFCSLPDVTYQYNSKRAADNRTEETRAGDIAGFRNTGSNPDKITERDLDQTWRNLRPLATFHEEEGLSLVITREVAEEADIVFDCTFRLISLRVHSSLEAVGLTAAIAGKLASKGISANVIAAFHHDHILVPTRQAEDALAALKEISA